MTYLVTETCIRRGYTDRVEVCPGDCFHVGETMPVIDPAGSAAAAWDGREGKPLAVFGTADPGNA